MSTKFEVGTWTGNNTSPQTITLADGSLTPIAIIVTSVASGTPGTGTPFVPSQCLSIGFGTRRSGSTQTGCVGIWSSDAVATTSTGRVRNKTLLHLLSAETTTDYTVSLDSFAAGQFTVSYSSAANANRDQFQYWVFGGTDLTDANVLNYNLSSTGVSQVVSGVGFQPDVLLALDSDLLADNTPTSNLMIGFGVATSSTQFWAMTSTETDGDTMASTMNWNGQGNNANCLSRLTINADTQDALWDLNSFDSDGCTLGVNDAPLTTTRFSTFLFMKGGTWEAGQHTKNVDSGTETYNLTNSSLIVRGMILATQCHASNGINTADTAFVLGAGSTANSTRSSAVNNVIAIIGDEAISTDCDRYRATDAIVVDMAGTPATEDNDAYYYAAGTGSYTLFWPKTTVSHPIISYLAIGDGAAAAPTTRELAKLGVGQ